MNLQAMKLGMKKAVMPMAMWTKAHSPQILTGLGVATGIGCVVTACTATLKVEDVMDQVAEKKALMVEAVEEPLADYTEEAQQKETIVLYLKTAGTFAKLYAPAIVLGVTSIGCFLGANKILTRRNAMLLTTLNAVEQSFRKYRDRVVEEFGEEKDFEFRTGVRKEKITEEYVDEKTGKTKKKKVEKNTINPNDVGMYTQIYDSALASWSKDSNLNKMTLKARQNLANDRLQAYGFLFLSDVLEDLGYPREVYSNEVNRTVGWIADWYAEAHNLENGDGYVDFGIYDMLSSRTNDFVNGYEPNVLLDFNVDGAIIGKVGTKWNR